MIAEKEENFYELVYKLFYEFSKARPEQTRLVFSKNIVYPILELNDNLQLLIPLPKLLDGKYVFEGMVFDNTTQGRTSLWSLFLTTIYHLAAHAAISTYSNYKDWRKNKTEDTIWKVIDFIEDTKVCNYLSNTNSEILRNIEHVESKLVECIQEKKQNGKFQKNWYFAKENERKLELVKKKILESIENKHEEKIIDLADFLYVNQTLLSNTLLLPFQEHHAPQWFIKFEKESVVLQPFGMFEEMVAKLDELWQIDEQAKTKLHKKYGKYLENLNFDRILIPSGNLGNFAQIKSDTLSLIRRIRQQTLTFNLLNDSKICEIGNVNLQMAIQGIASEGLSTDIFENDEVSRAEEGWIILVDNSASMGLRFDKVKEFLVCISESATELTGKPDAWGLYSFDNNFQILKDFKEKYNLEVQARIGGIQTGGFSLLPDAIELATRILADDQREKKYIFVITDGHPSGYERIQEAFSKITKKTEISGITLVAIGVSKGVTRSFKNNVRSSDLKQLISKFIKAYRTVSSDM